MDAKSTAVVLIEYQNDFTSDGGTLHQAVKHVMGLLAELSGQAPSDALAVGVIAVSPPTSN
jgi:hypothetical protein